MFEYQTTGTHIVSYSALEVLLVNAREGAVEERRCGGGGGGRESWRRWEAGLIHRWVGALCLLWPLSSSHGGSASSESRRPYGAGRHPEMLRILGLVPSSPSASGSGAGSSDRGKPRRSHGATVWQKKERVNKMCYGKERAEAQ